MHMRTHANRRKIETIEHLHKQVIINRILAILALLIAIPGLVLAIVLHPAVVKPAKPLQVNVTVTVRDPITIHDPVTVTQNPTANPYLYVDP